MSKDYYNILGVDRKASQDEVKKAYRHKAHQYHPDRGGDEARFKEVNEAYQILGNPEKRAQYDQFGQVFDGSGFSAQGGQPGFDFSSNFDFGDFDLGDILGDFFSSRGGHRVRKAAQGGRDIGVTLEISLEEAFRGVVKDIELRKLVKCNRCEGRGCEPGTGRIKCKACGGEGEIRKTQRTLFGVFSHSTVCPTCQGEGEYPEQSCGECSGEGRVRKIEKLSIPIPAGIESGGLLRVHGKGEEGVRGGAAGDLEIRVVVKSHPIFERKGADLYSQLDVSFSQAALGANINVKTIDTHVELKIPEGAGSGTVFKLKGKGMPFSASRRGDQYVKINVRVPKKLSPRARKLLEELGDEI
ncbi:MAG: molecular chaperone DnaJ [Parcubacteria group bacterium]|nr:molecular chaperone DnaJ [Parcubacteria group bacterium]